MALFEKKGIADTDRARLGPEVRLICHLPWYALQRPRPAAGVPDGVIVSMLLDSYCSQKSLTKLFAYPALHHSWTFEDTRRQNLLDGCNKKMMEIRIYQLVVLNDFSWAIARS